MDYSFKEEKSREAYINWAILEDSKKIHQQIQASKYNASYAHYIGFHI